MTAVFLASLAVLSAILIGHARHVRALRRSAALVPITPQRDVASVHRPTAWRRR